ncbi:MAG: MFS transporter [Acidimicrobiia bacterium]
MKSLRGWRALSLILFVVAFGTNVPTPLLLHYRAELGLSAATMTAIFAVYAAGLLPTMLLAGRASDRLGRRRVVGPFVVLAAFASLLFIQAASSVPLLFLSRFLQGAACGVVLSVGSAWLAELSGPASQAARRTTVALSAGWAIGPLASGALAQWGPAPTTLPYLIHLALMAGGMVAFIGAAEPGEIKGVSVTRAPPVPRIGIPRHAREAFRHFVFPVAVTVFTFPSVSVTVLPLLIQRTIVGFDLALSGLIAALTMLAGVLVAPLAQRLGASRAGSTGMALGASGLLAGLLASGVGAWLVIIPAAVMLGAGYGLCLVAGLTVVGWVAEPDARGALTSVFYALAYLGFAAPVLVTLAARRSGLAPPILALTTLLALGAIRLSRSRVAEVLSRAQLWRAEAMSTPEGTLADS